MLEIRDLRDLQFASTRFCQTQTTASEFLLVNSNLLTKLKSPLYESTKIFWKLSPILVTFVSLSLKEAHRSLQMYAGLDKFLQINL